MADTAFTEDEIKVIAAQLRKPEGEMGEEIARRMNDGNRAMNLHTLAVLDPQPNDAILEIGMGNGHFVRNIVRLDASIRYVGGDYSADMVAMAAGENTAVGVRGQVQFIHADARALPMGDEAFNKVFTVNTFYFWDDHVAVLEELRRVLKPSGMLILAVRPRQNMLQFPVTKYGFAMWDNDTILDFLQTHGFTIMGTTYIREPDQIGHPMAAEREALIVTAKKI